MTIRETESASGGSRAHWPSALAGLTVGLAFFSLWAWLLSKWLDFSMDSILSPSWRWLGVLLSVPGFAVALRCVWDFAWTGHGTPAPVAPPKKLVVTGFYRYVRNPMYVGFVAGWVGLWIVLGHANPLAIGIAVAVVLGVHLFVIFYEEPTLRRKFGADYENYCRHVSRWRPRVKAWRP
jgi:protein-S-isoprenylcysteine O-methyltransferase Ste14